MTINRIKFLLKSYLLKVMQLFDLGVVRVYRDPIDFFEIDLLLDVGANIGQYASLARGNGYKGSIVSFEPLKDAHSFLVKISKSDSLWSVHPRCAIGSDDAMIDINVAKNSYSSSVLPILESHVSAAPKSQYIKKYKTNLVKLDSIFDKFYDSKKIFLKIDTQGYEKEVLDGVSQNLKNISVVQLELSTVYLYEGQELYDYYFSFFDKKDFTLWSLEKGFSDKNSGKMLQFDAVFVNNKEF